ncbi:MAG: DNA polymerase Y family protein [Pseudomonadales bacterium]
MLWLALQFPHLGLEVWEQTGSAAVAGRLRPTVLVEQNRVVLCNEPARTSGIQPGASLATAHSISGDLTHHQRDADRERARLRFLGAILYRFSAQVSLEPPDALVLEIGGSLELFGDPAALAREARDLCRSLGHEVRWQLAATPGAALAMAAAGVARLTDVPLIHARLPDGDRHLERLANMGLNTLAPLLELPDVELGRRFGPALVDHLARLAGRIPDPKRFLEPDARFDQSLYLLEPIRDKAALLAGAGPGSGPGSGPMERLLADLEQWLISHQLGAEQLIWTFSTHAGDEQVCMPVTFARALQSRQAFLNVIRLRLERVSLPEDVLSLRLEARHLVPWLGGSRQLFGSFSGQPVEGGLTAAEVGELIDQLRARLGNGACSRIATNDQHAPESAWHTVPVSTSGSLTRSHADRHADRPSDRPSDRPLWLFDPPRPTKRDHLELLKGPERIQTEWWQLPVRRDYYVANLDNGARCWAFVDGENRWYLHGYFG